MFDELLKYLQLQIGMMDLSFNGTNLIEIAIIAIVNTLKAHQTLLFQPIGNYIMRN